MRGTTSRYAVDPTGEYVLGVVTAGAMRVRRGGETLVFGPGDVCAWDPSAAHRGSAYGGPRWSARLIVLETATLAQILDGDEPPAADLALPRPRIRDVSLARRFVHLHRALETPSWALEHDWLLAEWVHDVGGGDPRAEAPRRPLHEPALRRACELLHDRLPGNVTLRELEMAAGVSRHRLSRLFRAAFGMPPHRFQLAQRIAVARRMLERGGGVAEVAQATGFFDQSHLHRHFTATLGMTPAAYAQLTAQTYKTQAVA
jgi:AraC-like DNA-binding protein